MTSIAPTTVARQGLLAQSLQELLTVAVRLRTNPPTGSTNAETFRANVHAEIANASREALQLGYGDEDRGYATYAVVAFLDESVLAVPNASFASWRGRPLQEELFGVHVGGDVFFDHLGALLSRSDSSDLGDVLEVFQLCLLLGFKGRYGASGDQELHSWTSRLRDRIAQIRGGTGPMSPTWAPPQSERIDVAGDPWQRRLRLTIGGTLAVTLLLFLTYWIILGSRVGRLVGAGS